ncbi:MAG TPA: FAD-dependent oxidoreductase, partial [Candidatus Moranbacteria bacterium]|nr:FAD-dependent oxidoreductase [Candidatus Moranbacteria bacterium]
MYDLIIIGAGPAGLAASIYASRYKLKHLIIGEEVGGQIMKASRIENWPGEESITGMQLTENFRKQVEKLGGEIINIGVDDIEKLEGGFRIVTDDEKVFEAKTIIFALGMKPRKMNLPKEDEFIGKGISYCATCDAMFFKKKDVVIIGGGDSAATAALHLAEFANSVQLLYKNGTKIFEPVWEERMLENGKITLESFENILEIIGESKIEGIAYEIQNGQRKELKVQGIFIEIGSTPGAVIAKDLGVETDEHEFIIVKP